MTAPDFSGTAPAPARPAAGRLSVLLLLAILIGFLAMSYVLSHWLDARLQERSLAELRRAGRQATDLIDVYARQLERSAEMLGAGFAAALPEGLADGMAAAAGAPGRVPPGAAAALHAGGRLAEAYGRREGLLAALFVRSGDGFTSLAGAPPARGPARLGPGSPIVQRLLAGSPFLGVAELFAGEYMLDCRPLLSRERAVVGAGCVGIDFAADLARLKERLRSIRIGDLGYVYVVDVRSDPGVVVIHPRHEGLRAPGSGPGQRIARLLRESPAGIVRYEWRDEGEAAAVRKIAAIEDFERWGWRVVASAGEDEAFREGRQLRLQLFGFGLPIAAVLLLVAFLTVRHFRRSERALRAGEERLRSLFDLSPVGIVLSDPDGSFIDFNEAFRAMTGHDRHALLALGFRGIVADAATVRADPCEREYRRCAGGTLRVRECSVRVPGSDGRDYVWSIVEDVTERHRAELALRLAASAFLNLQEGVAIFDADGNFLDANEAFMRITGYARDELLGRSARLLKSGRHDALFYRGMWNALAACGHWRGELWNRRKNGEIFPARQTISAIRDARGATTRYVSVLSDVSEIKAGELRLQRMAHYDPLTGLPNRTLLGDRLRQSIAHADASGTLLAVCHLDLDNFKPVNDEHGHDVGDRILARIAERMTALLRGGDTVARLGGDEFALLLQDQRSVEQALAEVRRILEGVAAPVELGPHCVAVTASIGVTVHPGDDEEPDILLRHANQAMYLAKESGKNALHLFNPARDRRVRVHRQSARRIEAALADGEFVLHYQPKVDMRRGKVVGVEALIRWQHPERGLLQPIDFLPLIEESDLIVAVGDWVIGEALRQMAVWQACGLRLGVSVNIAARQLQQPDFVRKLQAALASAPSVDPGLLELEVVETAALEDVVHVSRMMTECQDLGVRFALDDFGTGYSSLTYFKRLPADTLKIDQSFVRDMINDPEDLAIVEAVIGLTEVFRRQAVAEGVETIEHGIMLLRMGCDLAQGYSISRPLPPERIPAWIDGWTPDAAWSAAARLRWRREDFPLVLAEIDHRRWVDRIVAHAAGEAAEPAALDSRRCHFWRWFAQEGMVRYGWHPRFEAIRRLHETLHALGREILEAKAQGRDVAARVPELAARRDELLALLHTLMEPSPAAEQEPLAILGSGRTAEPALPRRG
ncbi:MAG: EAL domain-containing protein [Rhodocyclaceae bacterium]|nr:EAL domain-containing protein [Rhodocyclaceae bacterium]